MTAGVLPDRLSAKVRMIEESLQRSGVPLRSMKKAGSLETNQDVRQNPQQQSDPLFRLDYLEGTHRIAPQPVPHIAPTATAFRYFLDGTQKTLPVWRIGIIPIVVSSIAVGVLERGPGGESRLLPESLDFGRFWFIPRATGIPEINRLVEAIEESGEEVIDPIEEREDRGQLEHDYEAIVGQFNRIVGFTYAAAQRQRAQMERDALRAWSMSPFRTWPDGWIVVDGRLSDPHPQAIGLVKSLQTQILRGPDAVTLFDLKQGHRTTAFRIRSSAGDQDQGSASTPNTHWYMRFWDGEGFDAQHGLAHIEAPPSVASKEQIDEVSSWILAERLPRATEDPRWPSLLYPIHILERILKRRLAASTTGWPA